jgi:hypothetical protein
MTFQQFVVELLAFVPSIGAYQKWTGEWCVGPHWPNILEQTANAKPNNSIPNFSIQFTKSPLAKADEFEVPSNPPTFCWVTFVWPPKFLAKVNNGFGAPHWSADSKMDLNIFVQNPFFHNDNKL